MKYEWIDEYLLGKPGAVQKKNIQDLACFVQPCIQKESGKLHEWETGVSRSEIYIHAITSLPDQASCRKFQAISSAQMVSSELSFSEEDGCKGWPAFAAVYPAR